MSSWREREGKGPSFDSQTNIDYEPNVYTKRHRTDFTCVLVLVACDSSTKRAQIFVPTFFFLGNTITSAFSVSDTNTAPLHYIKKLLNLGVKLV